MTPIPDAGDIILLDFDPQAGKEITKRRPALVLSPKTFNQRVHFAWVCPITSTPSKHGFQLALPEGIKDFTYAKTPDISTVKLEQLRSLDFQARNAQVIARVPVGFLKLCQSTAGRVLQL